MAQSNASTHKLVRTPIRINRDTANQSRNIKSVSAKDQRHYRIVLRLDKATVCIPKRSLRNETVAIDRLLIYQITEHDSEGAKKAGV